MNSGDNRKQKFVIKTRNLLSFDLNDQEIIFK